MKERSDVAVIGAGIGGLCAAVYLAARGLDVALFEAAAGPGGKIACAHHDGVEFDTGPSLLTLPHLLDEVFRAAGTSLDDEVELVHHELSCRHHFADGTSIDVYGELDRTISGIRDTLGRGAADEFGRFLEYARDIWEAAAPNFVLDQRPSLGSIFGLGLRAPRELMDIDPLSTMLAAIERRVSSAHLRHMLTRYITYVGSDPRCAPATLNCIAWVELGGGQWGVAGGMYEVVRALERLARRQGVAMHFDQRVAALDRRGSTWHLDVGKHAHCADAVVVNANVEHLVDELLAHAPPEELDSQQQRSMSAWTAVVAARRREAASRPAHAVLYPADYGAEFEAIFDRGEPPTQPAVYLCAQEKAHRRLGWDLQEPLFVMINAPAEPTHRPRDTRVWRRLRCTVLERLRQLDLIEVGDELIWERTPAGLARRFPSSRGALYGAASNSKTAAFRRPANRLDSLPGLFLAGGSVHPGGGVPMCAQSGRLAAEALLEART